MSCFFNTFTTRSYTKCRYPFGSLVPNRHASSESYRYGFQGQEKDDEIKGEGNSLNYTFRMHDPRIGRFFAIDPLFRQYPFYSPYAFSGNRVIDAVELEGKEPKIVVTDQPTGQTRVKVYGEGDVRTTVVNTYKVIVSYIDSNNNEHITGEFNTTRDSWYGMGTDQKGNTLLYNRSSDPAPDAGKLFIANITPNKYGKTTAFQISPIKSPLPSEYNKTYFKNGLPDDALPSQVLRKNNTAYGAEFHVGGIYENDFGQKVFAGTYGCYGIVEPKQIVKEGESKIIGNSNSTSNNEMSRFENSVNNAQQMQVLEHGKEADVEVEIKKRNYDKEKTVPKS